jgi:hypothetical protein
MKSSTSRGSGAGGAGDSGPTSLMSGATGLAGISEKSLALMDSTLCWEEPSMEGAM